MQRWIDGWIGAGFNPAPRPSHPDRNTMTQKRLPHSLVKPLVALASPGMYLVHKYSQFKRQQQESQKKKVTEKELQHLNHKIVSIMCSCCIMLVIV